MTVHRLVGTVFFCVILVVVLVLGYKNRFIKPIKFKVLKFYLKIAIETWAQD